MEREVFNDKETITIKDGELMVMGRSSSKTDHRTRSLRSLVEDVFRKGIDGRPIETVRLHIGSDFVWEVEPEQLGEFDQQIFDRFDEMFFDDQGKIETRIKLIALS